MTSPPSTDAITLAERVAALVTAHPAVAGLHGGVFEAVATYLPGRRLTGVVIGAADEPVELGVVLRLDRPFPEVVRALRREVSAMCGGAAVDITVGDVAIPHRDVRDGDVRDGDAQDGSVAEDLTALRGTAPDADR